MSTSSVVSTSTGVSTSTSVVSSSDPGRIAQPSSELTGRPIHEILPTVLFPKIFEFLPVSQIIKVQGLCRAYRDTSVYFPAYLDFRGFPDQLVELRAVRNILARIQHIKVISLKLTSCIQNSGVIMSDLVAQKDKLDALQTLEFMRVTGKMQGLSGLPITDLDLRVGVLSGDFFHQVQFPELRRLDLSYSLGINSEFIRSLSQFPKLQQLEMEACRLTDQEICDLNAPLLERLNVGELSNQGLTVVAKCRNLTSLRFKGKGFDDRGLESIPHLALRELSISEAAITGEGLLNLEQAKSSLKTLSLRTCKQIKVADLMIFRQLQTLSLKYTDVDNGEMQALANLSHLRTLELDYIEKSSIAGFEKLAESSSLQDVITVGPDMLTTLMSLDPKPVSESCIRFTIGPDYVGERSYKFLPRKEKTQALDLGIKPD